MTDFIKYKGNTLRVVYVDPSLATGPNDGDSISGALWNLPALATSLSGNAAYIIRRTATPAIIRKSNCPNNNVLFIGMPSTSGQLFYKDLSQTAKTAWAADVTSTTTVYVSGYAPNTPLRFGLDSTYGGYGLYNINFLETELSDQKYGMVHVFGSTNIDNCSFSISGYPLSGNLSSSLTEWSGLHLNTAEGLTINNVYSTCYGHGSTYSSPSSYQLVAGIFVEGGGSNCSITNSSIRIITPTSWNDKSFGLYIMGTVVSGIFKNLKFYNDGLPSGVNSKYTFMRINNIANGCILENISGWNYNPNGNPTPNRGIEIDYGTTVLASNHNYAYKRKSSHTFNNINFYDKSYANGAFTGIHLGGRFHDCSFNNITLCSPSASNYEGYYGMFVGDYSTHNKFNNMFIDYGSAQDQVINNNNDCYALYIGGNAVNQKIGKNYITNSIFKCSRVGVYGGETPVDISNTTITGGIYVQGDSIDLNVLEAPNRGSRYGALPYLIYHPGGSDNNQSINPTDTVIRIKELINNSGTGYTINYGTAKVSVEVMSSAGLTNTISGLAQSENSGAIYLNNYPQKGFWSAQNQWHRLDTSVVQFVTVANISSGYSLAYTYLTNANYPSSYGTAEQALIIAPTPYTGAEIPTTQALSAQNQYNAVLYFATKNASAVTSSELWFDLVIPDGTTGTKTRTISSRAIKDGVVTDTIASRWSGDAPLSIFKITLPFILDRSESVYSRIYWNKVMPGGTPKAYIAPRIIIE